MGEKKSDTQKTYVSFHWKSKITEISWWFVIITIDEADLKNRKNKLINDISNFNNKDIIQWYSVTQSNTP